MTEQLRIANQMLAKTKEWRQNRRTTIGQLDRIASNVNSSHSVSLTAKVVWGVSNVMAGAVNIAIMFTGLQRLDLCEHTNIYFKEDGGEHAGLTLNCLLVDVLASCMAMWYTGDNADLINANVIPMLKEDQKRTKYLGSLITKLHDVCQEQITSDTAVCNMSSEQLMSSYLLRAMGKISSSRGDRKPFGFSCLKGDSCGAIDVAKTCAQTAREAEYKSRGESYHSLVIKGVGAVTALIASYVALGVAWLSQYNVTMEFAFRAARTTIGTLTIGFGLIQLRNALSQTHCVAASELRHAARKLQEQLDEVESDMEEYKNPTNIE